MRGERRLHGLIAAAAAILLTGVACTTTDASASTIPAGRYNCYMYGASRPMPWDAGYGGAFEVPTATTRFVMHLTIRDASNYQYSTGGTGRYRYDARSKAISWISGPFASGDFRAAFDYGSSGRPVIFLETGGSRAYCIGPAGDRAAAPPPPAPPAPQPRPAPAPNAAQPRQPAAPPPAPARPAGGGLPVGSYACTRWAQYVGEIPVGHVAILEGGRYRAPEGGTGTYTYDAASRALRWTSGPFTDRSVSAQLLRRDDGKPAIRVAPTDGGDDPGRTLTCVLH